MGEKAGQRAVLGFAVATVVLLVLLSMEWIGLFRGVNGWLNSALPVGGPFMNSLTDTASFALTVLYLILFVLWDFKDMGRLSRFTLELTAGIAVSMVIVGLLKVLTGVPRPGEASVHWSLFKSIKNADYFAFPSGHATRAAVLAYFLSRRWKKLWPFWWGWAVVIAISRLLLHVHWFSDVVFALLLGVWAGILVVLTEDRWIPYYRAVITALKLEVFDVE